MRIYYLIKSARGIESSFETDIEHVTDDHRATFSFFELDGELVIYISTLSKDDRTPQREKEVIEKVMALINANKQNIEEE